VQAWAARSGRDLYLPLDPLETLSDADKVGFLEDIDARTRRLDPRIKQVMVSLSGEHEVVLVVGSDGTFAADVRPLVRCNVSVIVEQNGASRAGLRGRRRPFRLSILPEGGSSVRARARSRAAGAREPRGERRAGGQR
jgi:TldD protein